MSSPLVQHIADAYIHAATLTHKTACCVSKDGSIVRSNTSLRELLQYDELSMPTTIFEIAPSTSFLSWRTYWNAFDDEECVEEMTMLMKSDESFLEIQSTSCRVEIAHEPFCYIYFDASPSEMLDAVEATDMNSNVMDRMAAFTMDNANEMIFWVTKAGDMLYVNQLVAKTMQYSRAEVMKMKAWEFSSLVQTEAEWHAFFEQVKKEGQVNEETEQYRKDGGVTHVYTSSSHFRFEGIEYLFGIALDVTDRRERERMLEKMKYSLDNTHELVSWIGSNGQFIYVNNKMASESGYDKDQMLQMYIWDIAVDVDAEEWEDIWQSFVDQKELGPRESTQVRKDGTQYPVEVTGNYFSYHNTNYVYSRAVDITNRKQKDAHLKQLVEELKEAKELLENERNYLKQEITVQSDFNEIITQNRKYKRVLQQIQQVAPTPATVLILGETGTGKELIARAIHNLSDRADRAMIKINCAALPSNLIESELFGHEKGAFTGAYKKKIGRFEVADGGTVFLDEIGEMPVDLQSKLLRALQEGEFERLGSTTTIKADVRVIAATNRNLEQMVKKGKFREDLYYRLNVFPIVNMPLRERKDDIPPLVRFFVNKFCKKLGRDELNITQSAINHLSGYDFPGNIRELENMIERAVILSDHNTLNVYAALPETNRLDKKKKDQRFLSLEEAQRKHIVKALEKTDWKVTGRNSAAELLQINGKTLASRIKKLNISH
ncbi:MAG: sigma 54-interacting transcriptional regulator [Bacteroidota bacterium]